MLAEVKKADPLEAAHADDGQAPVSATSISPFGRLRQAIERLGSTVADAELSANGVVLEREKLCRARASLASVGELKKLGRWSSVTTVDKVVHAPV